MSQLQLYRSPAKPGYLGGYNWPAVVVGLLVLVVANFFCTQYIANRFQYQPALGPPLLRLRAGAIYQPFAWAKWGWQHLTDQDPAIRMPFLLGMLVLVAGCFLSVGVFFAMTNRRARRLSLNADHLHGSACWAEESDIYQDRGNTSEGSLTGGAAQLIDSTINMPTASLSHVGGSNTQSATATLVCYTVSFASGSIGPTLID